MATFRADFKFCGYYNGKDMPAAKWLKKLDWELEGYMVNGAIPPHRFIQAFELLLTEDASAWAETHPQAVHILNSDEPTADAVKSFRSLLCARFPMKSAEVSSISFDTELSELKQHDESLAAYYKRLTVLMQHVGARDRPSPPTDANPPLSMLEAAMLESIMKAFLRGLSDPDVRREATRGLASPERSLLGVYNLADEARRTKSAVQKLDDEEHKARENEILRSLVEKTMSKAQLDSLVSSFQTNAGATTAPPQWNLDGLSKLLEKLNQPSSKGNGSGGYHADHRPSDRSEPPPYNIAQNPDRRNGSGPDYRDNVLRKPSAGRPYQNNSSVREINDRSKSKNPFINGSRPYSIRADGPLCVRCGELNAKKDDGHRCLPLPAWEQSYLRELVFGTPAQSNFAAAGFGEYDGNVSPWSGSSSSNQSTVATPSSGSVTSQSNCVTFGVSEAYRSPKALANYAQAYYGEGSGPNKRPHVEEVPDSQGKQSEKTSPPAAQQPQAPYQFYASQPTAAAPATMDETIDRQKRKGKKRVGRKIELQPLVGLFNEGSGSFDSPMSVRAMLQHTKVDMSWMDLVAWSPAIGRELKRLCTRVAKKREKKVVGQQQKPSNPFVPFNPAFTQQYPNMPAWMPVPPMMPQTFAPQQPQGFVLPQQGQQPHTGLGGTQPSQSTVTGASQAAQALPDSHTKLLSTLVGAEKAFRISGTVKPGDGTEVTLDKKETQADQGSEMNVVSPAMVKKIKLQLRPLSEVGFKGLTMQTADHRETLLESYVGFDLCVEGIWRTIRCFVSPAQGLPEEPRLLLGLPWLYSVNAVISVRQSSIQIGDPSIGERVRYITGPELVYHRDHNMLMYPKAIIRSAEAFSNPLDTDSDESSDESEDDLSDIDDAGF